MSDLPALADAAFMHMPRSVGAVLLAAVVFAAGCTTQVAATPTPSPVPSIPPSTEPPSPSPSPSSVPTVQLEAAGVPESAIGSSTLAIVTGGEGLVAIGFNGGFGSILWTSTDGRTWTDVTPENFASIGITNVAEFDGGLVGVGRGDTINIENELAAVYRSDDGLTWRMVEGGDEMRGQLIDVVATDDGLYAVGGVPGADAAGVWFSADGETWQRTGGDFDHAFMWSIAEGGPGLVAVGWRRNPDPDLAVWTSADGVEWTLSPDPEGFAGYEATDVVAHEGTLVMVGSSFTGEGGRVWFSDDGVAWGLADVAGGMDGSYARSVAITPTGLVAVGGNDAMEGLAWFSTDGRSWEPLGDPVPNAFFTGAVSTDTGLLLTGATQLGTLETGIEAHAMVWAATAD